MVPNVPFYLSQANTEFGGGGVASTTLSRAGVPAPRLLSALAGRSAVFNFNLTIGYHYTGYEAQVGWTDVNGGVSPTVFDGRTIRKLMAYDDIPDSLYIDIDGPQRGMVLTIAGQGQVAFTSNGGYQAMSWGSIYSWLYARRNQVVACSLKYA